MSTVSDKQAIAKWQDLLNNLAKFTPVDINETEAGKRKRMAHLEKKGNEMEWVKYYFPKYATSEFAQFQKRSFQKFVRAKRVYRVKNWARGFAKTTFSMFEYFYMNLALKKDIFMLLGSKTLENAERNLMNYRLNLEGNQRIINDYGTQVQYGEWQTDYISTRSGLTIRAFGLGQNPRGAQKEGIRVTDINLDDTDDDEMSRNIDRLDNAWSDIEKKIIPTIDMSKEYRININNNIIAEDCIAIRAHTVANSIEVINLEDENGNSNWPEHITKKDIEDIKNIMSTSAYEGEYMNNPTSQGKTFKEITWGKVPQMRCLDFALVYADPATSNKDKPTAKSNMNASGKCVTVLGAKDGKFYVYTAWLDNINNSHFIDWFFLSRDYVGGRTTCFYYIENNSLQDPFYQQTLLRLFFEKGKGHPLGYLPITPDERKKPDKWIRIEAMLEPMVRKQELIFNIAEKDNPHMKRLETQFLIAKPTSKHLDGPDAIEGGVFIIKEKMSTLAVGAITRVGRKRSTKRF